MATYELRGYVTAEGDDIVALWLRRMRDRLARVAIDRRMNRMENGNFGDHRFCRDGGWELRIDVGPGYRVYYALDGHGSCFSCVEETNAPRVLTLPARANTGRIGNGGLIHERHPSRRRNGRNLSERSAVRGRLAERDLKDGDQAELLIVLRQLAKAFGGVQTIAEKADLNPTQLYRTLSSEGNPELRSLWAILKAMGLRLTIERVKAA